MNKKKQNFSNSPVRPDEIIQEVGKITEKDVKKFQLLANITSTEGTFLDKIGGNQVDKIIDQVGKKIDYDHKEHLSWQNMFFKNKLVTLGGLIGVLLFAYGVIYLVVNRVPEYTGEVIALFVGLFGGGGIGYGIGLKRSTKGK